MIIILFYISILFIFHTYVFYPLTVYFLSLGKKEKENEIESNLTQQFSISIILSVYNEEKIIREKLDNLLHLKYEFKNYEILIGSDGSSDQTLRIIRGYTSPNIRLFEFTERRGKAAVLNDLAANAFNEILVFTDANTFYDDKVLQIFSSHFSDPQIGGVCGYLQLKSLRTNSGGRGESIYWDLENKLKQWEGNYKTVFGATGGIYAIRRNLFVPLPTHKAITDDLLIPLKVVEQNYRMTFDRKVFGWEETTESTITELKRKIRIGAQNYQCITDIKLLLLPKYKFIAYGLWSHKIIRWIVPFFMIILLFSNITIQKDALIFKSFLYLQLAFYSFALIGLILDFLKRTFILFTLPYYFVVANLGLLIGFVRYLTRSQKAAWSVTRK